MFFQFHSTYPQIWAGTDTCEPVTWQECKLVPKDVQFIVPDVTCSNKQELWYHEPEPSQGNKMTNTFTCEVRFLNAYYTLDGYIIDSSLFFNKISLNK